MSSFLSGFSKLAALAFGQASEKRAARHLENNGYEILQRNFRCREGEIDLIAREGDILVFCEVKARRSASFGTALEGITPLKIKKIKKAAEVFMKKNGITKSDFRFDAVTIDLSEGKNRIEIFPNAF